MQPFLFWCSETNLRCPRTLVPDASFSLHHQAASREGRQWMWLGLRVPGLWAQALREQCGHAGPSRQTHDTQGQSVQSRGARAAFMQAAHLWGTLREARTIPQLVSSSKTLRCCPGSFQASHDLALPGNTADRKARSTGSLWREVGGGVSSRPPHSHPTSSTPHKLHQLPLCAGVHSVDGPEGGRKLFSFLGGQPSELKPPFVHQLPKLTLKNTSQCGFKWFSVILSSFQWFTLKGSICVRYSPSDKLQSLIPFKTSILHARFYSLIR